MDTPSTSPFLSRRELLVATGSAALGAPLLLGAGAAAAAGTAKRTAQIEKMTPTAEFHARPDKPVSFNKALTLSSLTQDRPSA